MSGPSAPVSDRPPVLPVHFPSWIVEFPSSPYWRVSVNLTGIPGRKPCCDRRSHSIRSPECWQNTDPLMISTARVCVCRNAALRPRACRLGSSGPLRRHAVPERSRGYEWTKWFNMCPGTWNACPCPWNDPNSSELINCKSSLHFWILTWHQCIWSLDGHFVISANVLSLHLETGQRLRETISNKWNHDSLFDFQPSKNLCESHFMVVGGLEPITAAIGVYSLNQLTRANV